jgi:two-component system cell cycle response regulator
VPGDDQFPDATVLVVDDNAQNRELLEAFLAALGCRVVLASGGEEALRVCREAAPDLLLLDIMMPRMSGYQVCQQLRADAATSDIPILVVTALGEVNDVERAREAGADALLTKPVGREELLERATAMLSRGRAAGQFTV